MSLPDAQSHRITLLCVVTLDVPVEASVPLTTGGSVKVYWQAYRWGTTTSSHPGWKEGHTHVAWIPAANVRRFTPSERDKIECHACPPALRSVLWASDCPASYPTKPICRWTALPPTRGAGHLPLP